MRAPKAIRTFYDIITIFARMLRILSCKHNTHKDEEWSSCNCDAQYFLCAMFSATIRCVRVHYGQNTTFAVLRELNRTEFIDQVNRIKVAFGVRMNAFLNKPFIFSKIDFKLLLCVLTDWAKEIAFTVSFHVNQI